MRSVRFGVAAGVIAALVGTAGAGPGVSGPAGAPTARTGAPGAPATPPGSGTGPDPIVSAILARMSLAQRVGQLFMVGGDANGVPAVTRRAIRTYHVGNVMLTGRSSRGVAATARIAAGLQKLATRGATAGVPLVLATDQEGGLVQVLRGPGFSSIPRATTQGTWSAARLRKKATVWGRQLHRAGVEADLAPVADTVPSAAFARRNDPIGYVDRQFGHTPGAVASHALAFVRGMSAAQVAATVKHFPGIGRVTSNPDTDRDVSDNTTTRQDPYLAPFQAAVAAGVPVVMVSTVLYSRIDARHPAAFSPTIVTGMLRDDLGFDGVVISDDLGRAKRVSRYSYGARAVGLIGAGGDVVLTVVPSSIPSMYRAVLRKARSDAAFRALVDRAATRVLTMKARLGLLR